MMAERERAEEALQTRVGELEKAVAQAERRGRLARESAREEMENERVEWMEGQRKRMASHMDTREEEMREEMRKERDREIEMVIGRLEEDAAKAEEATAKKWQTRVGQLETELERERARTRAEQDEMARRESQLSESREQTEKVRRELKALQSEQSRERARLVALESERATVERAVRSEVYDRQVELEREIGELRGARVRDRAEFDAELDAVQVRVRQAVAKKEDSVRVVRAQLQQAKARAAQLEALLEAQRVEFLSKNK